MRLMEEKSLITVEVVLLLFVVLTGIGMQICSDRVDNYTTELSDKISLINLTENERISQKISSLRYLFSAFADANVDVGFEEAYANSGLDDDYKQIMSDYETGKISKTDYFNRLSLKHNKVSYGLYQKYKSLQQEKDHFQQNKPIWFQLRGILFLIQFVAIFASILIYYFVYKSIGKRIKN